MRSICLVFAAVLLVSQSAFAAVFQYAVPVPIEKGTSTAFLWIPADAKQVRGVIIAGTTVMEKEFSKDPAIRKACASQQVAIVLLKCGLMATDLQAMLDNLAKVSGYSELSVAPLMFVGHSAGGPQAQQLAVKYGPRCFGLVQYRGGGPFDGAPLLPGIPSLMMMGEFDEYGGVMRREGGRGIWDGNVERVGAFRAKDDRNLASIVIEPGAGHFAWSDRNAAYLSLFIAKAAQAKIPATWPTDATKPVDLLEIDPKRGWLTSLDLRKAADQKPVAAEGFDGDKSKFAWHLDEELAAATLKYHANGFSGKDQFIRWEDPFWVDAGTRYFFTSLKWVGDGQTLEVHPAYAAKYPANQPDNKGPRWTQAGQAVGHSTAPILVKPVVGPAVATGPNTLRIQFDNISPASEGAKLNFMAYSVGDAEYRYTEQVGMTPRGFAGFKDGKAQTITFPPLEPMKAGDAPVELKATSDSGLKVEYYVAAGPAIIEEGKLKISELPARATLPIEVKVVAYQFGSGVKPQVKTAAPVEQVVRIEKP